MKIEKGNIYWYFANDLVCEVRIIDNHSDNKGFWHVETPFETMWIHESKLHERKTNQQ
jgi:V8-like Glu-specific endopeptidase